MDKKEALAFLKSKICEPIAITSNVKGFLFSLPYLDHTGDPIEISLTPIDSDSMILDDLGNTAGLLFSLNQHKEDSVGHRLIKDLTSSYGINMDYDTGTITMKITSTLAGEQLPNFIKVLISAQTVIPQLHHYYHKDRVTHSRLSVRLRRDIKELAYPSFVQKRAEVQGRNDNWAVDYKYQFGNIYILIVAADLGSQEPRQKAEHVISLATDLFKGNGKHDGNNIFRVVYDSGVRADNIDAQRAIRLIKGYEQDLGYQTYDYSDVKQKIDLMSQTKQELAPAMFKILRQHN
ncbi:MAG: DUF1828 domain-containing protein [Dehalococcoidia bacterium]